MVWYPRLLSAPKLVCHTSSSPNKDGRGSVTVVATVPISVQADLAEPLFPYPAMLSVQLLELGDDGSEHYLAPVKELVWQGSESGARVVKQALTFELPSSGTSRIATHRDGRVHTVRYVVFHVSTTFDGRTSKNSKKVDRLQVPKSLDVWTAPYNVAATKTKNQPCKLELNEGPWLQRRLLLPGIYPATSTNETDHKNPPVPDAPDIAPQPNILTTAIYDHDVTSSLKELSLHDSSGSYAPPELRLWEEAGESMARHVW